MTTAVFSILFVCTGNVCRSPLAEQILRARLAGLGKKVSISSAGAAALVGEPMTPQAQVRSSQQGGAAADEHRATQLTSEHLEGADLILALARDHRRSVVELLPRASRRTFTVREFARLGEGVRDEELATALALGEDDVVGRLRELAEVVALRRGTVPPSEPEDDDVIDPYRQNDATYDRSTAQLVGAIDAIITLLGRIVPSVLSR